MTIPTENSAAAEGKRSQSFLEPCSPIIGAFAGGVVGWYFGAYFGRLHDSLWFGIILGEAAGFLIGIYARAVIASIVLFVSITAFPGIEALVRGKDPCWGRYLPYAAFFSICVCLFIWLTVFVIVKLTNKSEQGSGDKSIVSSPQ